MKKASIENSRKVPMRRVRWPWVPPKPICITAKIKGLAEAVLLIRVVVLLSRTLFVI